MQSRTFHFACLEMADAGQDTGGDGRRERCREDETWREGANTVNKFGGRRDVSSHDAEGFGERTFDDVDPVHHPVARRDTSTTRTVQADAMHFIEIGQSAILAREIAQTGNLSK